MLGYNLCTFDLNDVIAVAKAVVDDPLRYVDGDFTPYFYCIYCDAELNGYDAQKKDFKHALCCPVLKAQDILTGSV